MATVMLNANRYVLANDAQGHPALTEQYVPRQSNPLRLIGTVFRENDPSMGHYVFGEFPLGIGWARSNRVTGRGVGGARFATADIRFQTQTLQLLAETQTHASPAVHPKARFIDHAGETWGFFERDYPPAGAVDSVCRDWNAATDTWDTPTSGAVITQSAGVAEGAKVFAAGTHKGNIFVVTNDTGAGAGAGSARSFSVTRNPNPETTAWAEVKGVGFPDNTDITVAVRDRNNFDDTYAAIVDEGNILLVALLFDASATTVTNAIRVYETSDLAVNWALTVTIPGVGESPMGFHRWRDPTNLAQITSVLVTNYNIYKIDSAANTATALLPNGVLSGNVDDGRANTVGLDGSLYLSLASGDNLKLTLVAENHILIENIGPATGMQVNGKFVSNDGLPAAFQGRANFCLDTPSDWMYWAYGGHAAATNATVLAYSKSRMAWYVMYDDPTANVDLYLLGYSTESDGIPRLFCVEEGAAAAVMTHQEYPNTPVTGGQTQNYEASSYIRHPVDSHGDPRTSKGVYHAIMDADNLSAADTGEYIQLQDGLDGAADTTNNRGNFLSGTLVLDYGASSVGVSALNVGLRETLFRDAGNTTDTPRRRELVIQAQPKLTDKRMWDFVIDLDATALEAPPTLVATAEIHETIIANIEAVAESVTKVAFVAGGQASVNVFVPANQAPVFTTWIVGSEGDNRGYRTGLVSVHVEESS